MPPEAPLPDTTPPPGPAHSATSDTPDFVLSRPAISASGMTGGDMPAEPAAPEPEPAPAEPEPAPAEPAEPSEPEPAPAEPAEPEPEPAAARKDSGVGKVLNAKDAEIARLAAEKTASDARAAKLQEQLNEALVKRVTEPPTPPVEVKPDLKPVPPKRADFETPDAYDAAMIQHLEDRDAWTLRQADARTEAKLKADKAIADQERNTATVNQDFAAAQAAHDTRIAKAPEKYSDFNEVAFANDVPISPSMAVMIINSEVGPDLMYALGKDKAEAARIASMVIPGQFYPQGHEWAGQPVPNVAMQARALGVLEGRFAAQNVSRETPPPVRKVSAAPAPVKPVGQRAAAAPRTPDQMTADEYYENHPSTRARRAAAQARGATTH